MSKKRENTPENESTPAAPGNSDETASLAPRLSVQLDENGAIAFDRMRADTRDKLTAAIAKSGLATSGAKTGQVVESFPPAMAEVIYDSLSMLIMGIAQRGGYTQEQSRVLQFNAQEKASLVPATVAVLNKYNTSLGKYQEEIMLGVLLVTITTGKLALLKKTTPVINMVRENTAPAGSQAES